MISNKIGDVLVLTRERREIISYGLSVFLSNLFGLVAILVIAYLIGAFASTSAMVTVLMLLRPNAGGSHCDSALNCSLFGCLFIPLLGLWSNWLSSHSFGISFAYLLVCSVFSVLGIYLKAPYFTQDKTRAKARSKKLKIYALLLAVLAFLASVTLLVNGNRKWSTGIATGLLFQGIMIFPIGATITGSLDSLLSFIKGGEGK